jgi:hypothetical protein
MTLFQGILKSVANKDKCDDVFPQNKFLAPFRQVFSKKLFVTKYSIKKKIIMF